MKIRFIINPCSGRNARRPWLARHIGEFISSHRLNASVVLTSAAGHATQLAREALAAGCDRIVAVGGDGTMNETAQALLNAPAALGLIPCGSGNGLARHLRIPASLQEALGVAVAPLATVMAIDSGVANGHPFFNAMGCGFDAEISHRFNRLKHRGLPAYARTGAAAFLQRRSEAVTIRAGSLDLSLDMLLIAVANSDEYGNGAKIAPGARVDDGELDLVAVRPINAASALPLLLRLFTNRLDRSSRTIHLRGPRFTIERTRAGLIHTDGETHETGRVIEVSVQRRSLRIIVPASVRQLPEPVKLSASFTLAPS